VVIVVPGLALRDPPAGYRPPGWEPSGEGEGRGRLFDLRGALQTWQWYALWAVFFLNVCAGVGFVSEGASMARDLWGSAPWSPVG
jgi:MFS transporter, OFA family, oxalate/formate antiporter